MVSAVLTVRWTGVPGWVYRVGIRGGVYQGGYTGEYPAARGGLKNQRSGPRKPRGGWSGWVLEAGRPGYGGLDGHGPHPCGARSVHPVALPGTIPLELPTYGQ